MRVARRTGRRAGARAPSAAEITADTAPVSPDSAHTMSPKTETTRAEAASCCSPSRAMKITSIA